MSVWLLLLFALVGCGVLMTLVFWFARRVDNYSVVDVAWAYAFAPIAAGYAAFAGGWPMRRVLLAALAVLWSVRLGSHLLRRVASHHPEEDGRYLEMRTRWKANFAWEMFKFYQIQALSLVILSVPFLIPSLNARTELHPLEVAGALLWFIALCGETLADAQLAAFKRNAANRGAVCDRGLWRYSRHPNYFFEWLVWVAFFIFACGSPWGWISVICPAVMLHLLLRVTGIPLTEQQALRSRGDAYRRYQQTTSAFFPWFPRRSGS
jgi:steroid 5-alpha reductase family enzyme